MHSSPRLRSMSLGTDGQPLLQPPSIVDMSTSGHTRPSKSSRLSNLPMSRFALAASLRARIGLSAGRMICTISRAIGSSKYAAESLTPGHSQIRVYNYNTSEKITSFEAHPDYIRAIAVHPTQPFVLTASDDMTIKLWDWEKGWKCVRVFEGNSRTSRD
jgi:FOG: WD40 repeat